MVEKDLELLLPGNNLREVLILNLCDPHRFIELRKAITHLVKIGYFSNPLTARQAIRSTLARPPFQRTGRGIYRVVGNTLRKDLLDIGPSLPLNIDHVCGVRQIVPLDIRDSWKKRMSSNPELLCPGCQYERGYRAGYQEGKKYAQG